MAIDILNTASFEYLTKLKLQLPALQQKDLKQIKKSERVKYQRIVRLLKKLKSPYDEQKDYKAQYRKLHELAESLQYTAQDLKDKNLKEFHLAFFLTLFENDNQIHAKIYREIIQPVGVKNTSDKERVSRNQSERSKRPFSGWEHPEHAVNRFFSGLLGIAYHPLKKNNIPYISFEHSELGRKNLRFGAQINGRGNVNKSFIQFLTAKKEKNPQKKFNHVYINLQKRDMKEGGKFERYFERKRSLALERLENREELSVAVITLPADSHFFFKGFSHHVGLSTSNEKTKLSGLKNDIIEAIKQNKNDFYMSDDIKRIVFGNALDTEVSALFRAAASDVLGRRYHPHEEVDPALRQAIFFHFVKFHLTDYILKKIDPESYNIACKDNIDRGGAHNLWYEFMQKIKRGEKVSLGEFQKNLDASAILVKDRPMNEHRNVLWNMLYQSFTNNPILFSEPAPWVGQWLAQNIPLEKELEKKLDGKSSSIKISNALKKRFASRLAKEPGEITDNEIIQLMQRDINLRINNIHKAQKKIETLNIEILPPSVKEQVSKTEHRPGSVTHYYSKENEPLSKVSEKESQPTVSSSKRPFKGN